MCTAPRFVARQRAAVEGFTLIAGSCFAASPAGTTNRADYEFMRDEVLAQLKAAQARLSLVGVLFGLRGASGQTASSAWNSIRIATLR
jgi:microcystin degradation protein MlrC